MSLHLCSKTTQRHKESNDIDEAFKEAGVALFPASEDDLVTDCSCPDWENPCKHVAAVHYLLAEAFDADPFLLFTLRGRDRGRLLEALRARRTSVKPPRASRTARAGAARPRGRDARPFWESAVPVTALVSVHLEAPKEEVSLLMALGLPPVWTSSRADAHGIVEAYRRATDWGLRLAYGQDDDAPRADLKRLGFRAVDATGCVRTKSREWYVGREHAGARVELLSARDGSLHARAPDGSVRRVRAPLRLAQMPPEG